jgi:hypothetical protein
MTTYTSITAGQVAVDAAIDTALMTALRDNPVAISEGDSTAPRIAGVPYLDERQEPTSDVAAITFSTDITGKAAVIVKAWGGISNMGFEFNVDVSDGAAAWRTMARYDDNTTSTDDSFNLGVYIDNIDNNDGTGVVRAYILHAGVVSLAFDRSAANIGIPFGIPGTDTITNYYSSHSETIDQVRFSTSGTFEGSTADKRTIAELWTIDRATRDA